MSYTENAQIMREMLDTAITYLDDEQAESVAILFPEWEIGIQYSVDDRRRFDDLLYRCIQPHVSQFGWEPPEVPALWARTSVEEWPEWIQPLGSEDAYKNGDKVIHNGIHWVSSIDGNVWEPGVYGWVEAEA